MSVEGLGSERERPAEIPTRRRTDRHTGVLVLIGGACDPEGAAFKSFIELCRAREGGGKIVGLTTASHEPTESANDWIKAFGTAGVRDVGHPHRRLPRPRAGPRRWRA
jgi:cyanophycinase